VSLWSAPLLYTVAKTPTVGWQAIGKVVQDITLKTVRLPRWEYSDWGYGSNKVKQLERNYINVEEIERVKEVLKRRSISKYTSVALSLRGKPKDARSQGWCMLSMVISRTQTFTAIEMQYRTTEAILKFAADVIFIQDIFDLLEIEPTRFTWRFANIALSGAYFPYLVDKLYLPSFLAEIRRADEEFFLRTTRFLLKSSYEKDQYHPFSPERVSHNFLWGRASSRQIKEIRNFLEPLHKATGRPLPKDFHSKETYIPKGQRASEEGDDE
jgi:hypothetical protein